MAQLCLFVLFPVLLLVVQVRNLCYMVSRREKLKLLQSKAQEQMFNLHVKLVNQDISAGEPSAVPQLASHYVLVCMNREGVFAPGLCADTIKIDQI